MGRRTIFTAGDLLLQHAGTGNDRIALIAGDEQISYDELISRATRIAAWLAADGVQPRDRVAIMLRKTPRLVSVLLGVYLSGAAAVLVHEKHKAKQIDHVLEHSGAVRLLSEHRLLRGARGTRFDADRIRDLGAIELPQRRLDVSRAVGEDLAQIIYTSGSTGMPKGIMLSHQNLVDGARTVASYLGIEGDDRLLSVLPFTFDYGLNQLTTALLCGATLVLQKSMRPADICAALSKHAVTGLAGVPLLWTQLTESSLLLETELPALRYVTNSGGHWPEAWIERFREAHPRVSVFPMYGLTEAFRSTYLAPDMVEKKAGSMGRAIPNVEILVIDDQGRECLPGEAGELVHRGAHIAMGYWRDPEATARVFRQHPHARPEDPRPETVVYSGDIVKRDGEGYLYFVGRKDQRIKSHGVRVSPEEIEHYLMESGLLESAVVFGVPKDDVDTKIVAVIVPNNPALFRTSDLAEYCRAEMPEYMRPVEFQVSEVFPQTTSGKPDRTRIREAFLAR